MGSGVLVSVVVPTYNRAEQTIAAIESVLAQSYTNIEIIVVDDGSTDGSGESIQQFINQAKNRGNQARYYRQPNQGPSIARNEGMDKARGEYISFLDSDDVWLPEKLEWQVHALDKFNDVCEACITDTQLVTDISADVTTFRTFGRQYDQTTGIVHDAVRSLAKSFCGFWVSTLLARTDVIKGIGGFDPNVQFAEDRDLFFALSQVTSIAYVNKPLVRTDRRSSAHVPECRPWEKVEVQLRGRQHMLEKWIRMCTGLPTDVRRTVGRNLRAVHSEWANWYLEKEQYEKARQAVARAIKYELTLGLLVKWVLIWFVPSLAKRIAAKSEPYV